MMVGMRVWRLELGFFLGWLFVSPLCYSVDILLFSLSLVDSFWIVVQLVSRLLVRYCIMLSLLDIGFV